MNQQSEPFCESDFANDRLCYIYVAGQHGEKGQNVSLIEFCNWGSNLEEHGIAVL